jgi:hypothetical protein
VVTPELILARQRRRGGNTVAGNTLHVNAVTFIAGCTAEEQPDVVGFDELGRITAAMRPRQSWTAPDYFTRFSWDVDATLGREALGQLAPRAGLTAPTGPSWNVQPPGRASSHRVWLAQIARAHPRRPADGES